MDDKNELEIDLSHALTGDEIKALFDAFTSEDWEAVDLLIDGISPEAYAEAEAKAGGADRNRGKAEVLRRYWTVGEGGAKIGWRTKGDFTRCVELLTEYLGPRAKGYCALRHKEMNGFYPGDKRNDKKEIGQEGGETKDSHYSMTIGEGETVMELQYKTHEVKNEIIDEGQGIVSTIVSVTGLVDEVKDVIEPGAYEKTLVARMPKGVWSHAWDTPVSKTLEVAELMPLDPRLPDTLPNGQPWPREAGAVLVKTQFNLETQRGREAYSDVCFFKDSQQWSIGYSVPQGGAWVDKKTGYRHITTLDWFEYSPVLHGAMPFAHTVSVKSAQEAFAVLSAFEHKGDAMHDDEDMDDDKDMGPAMEEDVEDEDTDEDMEAKLILDPQGQALLEKAIYSMKDLLDYARGEYDSGPVEVKEMQYDSLKSAVQSLEGAIEAEAFTEVVSLAEAVDSAFDAQDLAALESASTEYLDFIQESIESGPDSDVEGLQIAADAIRQMFADADDEEGDEGDEGDEYEGTDSDEDTDDADESVDGEKSLEGYVRVDGKSLAAEFDVSSFGVTRSSVDE